MKANGAEWQEVKLGDILRLLDERITMDDDKEYLTITVKRRHGGLEIREKLFGHQIATKKQFGLVPGAFIISRVQCWHQAYAIVGDVPPNTIASQNYDQFAISPEVDSRFFWWLSHSPAFTETVRSSAVGVVIEKMVFNREQWLAKTVRLPSLAEQRRVVARIEALPTQIEEARSLRHQAAAETEALLASFRRAAFGETPQPDWIPLSNYVRSIFNGKSPATEGRPAASDEWAVLKVGAVSFGVFDEHENKALPISYVVPPSMEVRPGDFIMSRANPVELVGACALVRKTRPKLMLSDKTFRFVFREPRKVVPEFMEQVLKSPPLREQIERGASGTSPTMKNISKEKVLALRLPPFALPEQRRIVAELDALQAEVDALKRLQAETAAELDALLPAILDKAFKGEL